MKEHTGRRCSAIMMACTAITLMVLTAEPSRAGIYNESDGLVVMEMENTTSPREQWIKIYTGIQLVDETAADQGFFRSVYSYE